MALAPLVVITVTSTVLTKCAGVTDVSVVSLTTVKPAAEPVPKFTPMMPLAKPVPLIVSSVPPVDGPERGDTPSTVGRTGGNMFGFIKIVPPLPTAQTQEFNRSQRVRSRARRGRPRDSVTSEYERAITSSCHAFANLDAIDTE